MTEAEITTGDVRRLVDIFAYARAVYRHYMVLFEIDNGQILRLAPICLGDIARVLKEYLILQVCKLTDRGKDHHGNENISIEFFKERVNVLITPQKLRSLNELAERLCAFGTKLKPARDKIISHFDRQTTHRGKALGGVDADEWNRFWGDLQEFVKILGERCLGEIIYINAAGQTDAEVIKQLLENGARTPIVLNTLP
jgi:hypothetical protein